MCYVNLVSDRKQNNTRKPFFTVGHKIMRFMFYQIPVANSKWILSTSKISDRLFADDGHSSQGIAFCQNSTWLHYQTIYALNDGIADG